MEKYIAQLSVQIQPIDSRLFNKNCKNLAEVCVRVQNQATGQKKLKIIAAYSVWHSSRVWIMKQFSGTTLKLTLIDAVINRLNSKTKFF